MDNEHNEEKKKGMEKEEDKWGETENKREGMEKEEEMED